jgi:hypothetical protein
LSYQGATVQLALDSARQTYRSQASRPIRAILRPIGGAARIRVDGGAPQAQATLLLEPGREYAVVSERE